MRAAIELEHADSRPATGVNTGEVVVGTASSARPSSPATRVNVAPVSSRPPAGRDPDRRRDARARPRRGSRRAGRAAHAQGQVRPVEAWRLLEVLGQAEVSDRLKYAARRPRARTPAPCENTRTRSPMVTAGSSRSSGRQGSASPAWSPSSLRDRVGERPPTVLPRRITDCLPITREGIWTYGPLGSSPRSRLGVAERIATAVGLGESTGQPRRHAVHSASLLEARAASGPR